MRWRARADLDGPDEVTAMWWSPAGSCKEFREGGVNTFE
jgi:hypothetical protein